MLQNLNFTGLSYLESGQHVKNVHTNLTASGVITDAVMQYYMTTVKSASDAFDQAMVQHAKSDETAKIQAADKERDRALATFKRAVGVFEYATAENQQLAYTSLTNLLADYVDLENWNFMEETNGIENLITDLEKPKYAPHVLLLGLGVHKDRLQSANENFKALFSGRTVERTEKPNYDSKQLRRRLYETYDDMANYVLTMSKVPNPNPQFATALGLINTERKYYSDLLARKAGGKTPPPTP